MNSEAANRLSFANAGITGPRDCGIATVHLDA
jgi:hypothetical protein